ncbi:MAG TPA: Uma2 family endonuclease, partial [Thermoanaerobaculia bacterium]
EYFLFDPLGEHLRPRLQGFLLADGCYLPLQPIGDGSLVSQMAGLRLELEGARLRLVDLGSGEKLLWAGEEREARQAAEARARAAEEEILRLRSELAERLRND